VDVFKLSPTDPIDRAFLKEILGEHKNKGGAYMFRVLKEGKEKWYVGKANNLYRRLLQHLQKVKLKSKFLESINVIVIINGVVKDFFKTEADVIKEFEGIKNLVNEINSPICKT
jgi:GIY-YIG catalytic domain protein